MTKAFRISALLAVLVSFGLQPASVRADWNDTWWNGTNLQTMATGGTNVVPAAYTDRSNTFVLTQSVDQVSATGIVMRGTFNLGNNWISPSGGPSGICVTAEGALNVGMTNSVYPLCVNASPNDPTAALSTMGLGSYANSGAAFINDAGAANFIFGVLSYTYSVRPVIQFNKYGGNYSSVGAVTNAHLLGDIGWVGYDGGARRNNMLIRGFVNGAVSSGHVPMAMQFFTGETSPGVAMMIDSTRYVGIGNTAPGYLLTMESSGGGYYSSSDHQWHNGSSRSIKTNIVDLVNGLAKLATIRAVEYDCLIGPNMDMVGDHTAGFVAEETAESAMPCISPKRRNDKGALVVDGVTLQPIVAILVRAVQEQQEYILSLEARLKKLEDIKQ